MAERKPRARSWGVAAGKERGREERKGRGENREKQRKG